MIKNAAQRTDYSLIVLQSDSLTPFAQMSHKVRCALCTMHYALKKVDLCRLFSVYARVTFPERRQRVQTFILRVSPSTMTRTL